MVLRIFKGLAVLNHFLKNGVPVSPIVKNPSGASV